MAKLYDGVRRNLSHIDIRCVCFTDDATTLPQGVQARSLPTGLSGWWNKIALFKPDSFEPGSRVLYFDLDVMVLGELSDIAGYRGDFAALSDPFWPEHINSSVMAWEAGKADQVWTTWDKGGRPQFDPRGDQFWIERMMPRADRVQAFAPRQVVSFKKDCWLQGKIPADARVLVFHGQPKPHNCAAGFIKKIWNRPLAEDAAA